MRAMLLLLVGLLGVSVLGCERNPPPAAPDQPCACDAAPGGHHTSQRTQIN